MSWPVSHRACFGRNVLNFKRSSRGLKTTVLAWFLSGWEPDDIALVVGSLCFHRSWHGSLFFSGYLLRQLLSHLYIHSCSKLRWDTQSSLEEFLGAGSRPLHKALDALGLGGQRQQSLGSENFGFLLAIWRKRLDGCLQVRTCTKSRKSCNGCKPRNMSKWSTITKACQLRTLPSRASQNCRLHYFMPWIQLFDCWLRIFADHLEVS